MDKTPNIQSEKDAADAPAPLAPMLDEAELAKASGGSLDGYQLPEPFSVGAPIPIQILHPASV
jgi:hypothetical protein